LLLKQSGDTAEAGKILADWLKADPLALPLKWCQAFFKGVQHEIEAISKLRIVRKEVLPYELPFEDRSFRFIKQLYSNGLLNKQEHLAITT
jgi:hypothetical protein